MKINFSTLIYSYLLLKLTIHSSMAFSRTTYIELIIILRLHFLSFLWNFKTRFFITDCLTYYTFICYHNILKTVTLTLYSLRILHVFMSLSVAVWFSVFEIEDVKILFLFLFSRFIIVHTNLDLYSIVSFHIQNKIRIKFPSCGLNNIIIMCVHCTPIRV